MGGECDKITCKEVQYAHRFWLLHCAVQCTWFGLLEPYIDDVCVIIFILLRICPISKHVEIKWQ